MKPAAPIRWRLCQFVLAAIVWLAVIGAVTVVSWLR